MFFPDLVNPQLERDLHEGRKRIDIVYTNHSNEGEFYALRMDQAKRYSYVFVKCKNYSDDLQNPEFDQLAGRFGNSRGYFGIICCRELQNSGRPLSRCRDALSDGRGLIIVLEDADVLTLLGLAEKSQPQAIRRYIADKVSAVRL